VRPGVCLTVDVEDWYDGMAVLGYPMPRVESFGSGLPQLISLLNNGNTDTARITLFTVGGYAQSVRSDLAALAASGHEIACHGPDHGRLPVAPAALSDWLRKGREMLEDVLQVQVQGFRSPRFDIPQNIGLAQYRELLANAGYRYVSDTHRLGTMAAVDEFPVLRKAAFPLGGGSYQRLFPARAVSLAVGRSAEPAVLYYHSYDFGVTLPTITSVRSLAVAKQVLGRKRIPSIFTRIAKLYGSQTCGQIRI
jgi:peptidoglycan-N-acetylglucosamine deacetylase